MTRIEMVAHLANLTTLIDHHEALGAPRNKWILHEFDAVNAELMKALKESYNETGKRVQHAGGDEGRAVAARNQPGGGGADRERNRPRAIVSDDERGPDVESTDGR